MGIGTLLIRADASAAIGTGHVMRCLALAQAWQDAGGRAVFAMAQSTDAIQMRVSNESCETLVVSGPIASADDLRQTVSFARHQNCEWVVVDGYQVGTEYQKGLKAAGLKVLFLDDYGHSEHYYADVVLNQNLSASPSLYSNRESQTRLLLGTQYALLRREFNVWRDYERKISSICRRVLVTMGGSDDGNVTATVIEGLRLAGMAELEVTVLVGGSNSHRRGLQDMVARSPVKMQLLEDVSNVGKLMAEADIAISAAGTTCWELCLLGLPSMLIDIADNQTHVAKELHKRGCAIHIGRDIAPETVAEKIKWLFDAVEVRESLSRSSRKLVDGRGATRVVSVLRGEGFLELRPAEEKDRRLLWEWANDPEVRASSFSPETIPWETHVAWFDAKLNAMRGPGSKNVIYIAESEDGSPIGQIRFDVRPDGDLEVGVGLDKKMRGLGMASQVIESGVRHAITKGPWICIHAFVKPGNIASVKAFERAAFRNIGSDQVRGNAAIHLTYVRN